MGAIRSEERRGLEHIVATITSYEQKRINLRCLIAEIEVVLGILQESMARGFREDWAQLEEDYSVALVMNSGVMNEAQVLRVRESLGRLRNRASELLR